MHLRPLIEAEARTISLWRYDGPYAFYNIEAVKSEESVAWFLRPELKYFCCAKRWRRVDCFFVVLDVMHKSLVGTIRSPRLIWVAAFGLIQLGKG